MPIDEHDQMIGRRCSVGNRAWRTSKKVGKSILQRLGITRMRDTETLAIPPDFDRESTDIIRTVKSSTLTSVERLYALIQAVRFVVAGRIPGGIVECGVWRGGSMMAVAHVLKTLGRCDIDLYLFDTYEGMPKPSEYDVNLVGDDALTQFDCLKTGADRSNWAYASLEEVRSNLLSTGYPPERLRFIKGKVEDTIPTFAPTDIALLRLDTDWYESTRHELLHLYPRLAVGGVLIIDDYGHWQGSKKAVDEYFAQRQTPVLLHRIDYTGRIGVKTGRRES